MNKQEILQLLQVLGTTSQEVAATLRRQGVKGYRYGDGGNCPINQYLANQGVEGCGVGAYYISYPDETEEPLPLGIGSFVRDFDHLQYRELMLE
jgi:hypothetical protein